MTIMPIHKYRPFPPINLPDRQWPSRVIDQGADLVLGRSARRQPGARRADGPGAQAPHVRPAAASSASRRSRSAFPPPRRPISPSCARSSSENLIPDDVTIQVLTQARAELIDADLRVDPRRQARDRAPLQLDLGLAAPRRVRARQARHRRHRGHRRPADPRSRRRDAARPRSSTSIRPRASPAPSSISRSRSARR